MTETRRELVVINSEEDAFALLADHLNTPLSDHKLDDVRFGFWPRLNIYLPNMMDKNSITPSMMEAFIDFQGSIYRTQKLIDEQTIDLRSLSEKEKKLYEFNVTVSGGSSNYDIDLTQIVTRLGGEIIAKMSPQLIVIGVVSIALILAASSVWRSHIQARVEKRKAEAALEEKRMFLDAQRFTGEQETRRMELLLRAKQVMPILTDVDELATDGRQSLIKGIANNAGGVLQDVELPQTLAAELTKSARQTSREEVSEGVYEVLGVDTTLQEGFRVRLQDIGTGEEFQAALTDRLVSEAHYRVVQLAEWNKTPIRLKIRARRLRGRVVEAVVLDAASAAPTPG